VMKSRRLMSSMGSSYEADLIVLNRSWGATTPFRCFHNDTTIREGQIDRCTATFLSSL
jgi:hypothetical protein